MNRHSGSGVSIRHFSERPATRNERGGGELAERAEGSPSPAVSGEPGAAGPDRHDAR
jgi:hypothetical protein